MENKHEVCDTHKRSLLISGTANVIEFFADTAILLVIGQNPFNATAIAAIMQVVCYLCTYSSLRIWNKIKWGRRVRECRTTTQNNIKRWMVTEKNSQTRFATNLEMCWVRQGRWIERILINIRALLHTEYPMNEKDFGWVLNLDEGLQKCTTA